MTGKNKEPGEYSWFDVYKAIQATVLPAGAQSVLMCYLRYAHSETGLSYPSNATIAYRTQLSTPTLRKWRTYLVEYGWLYSQGYVKGYGSHKGVIQYHVRPGIQPPHKPLVVEKPPTKGCKILSPTQKDSFTKGCKILSPILYHELTLLTKPPICPPTKHSTPNQNKSDAFIRQSLKDQTVMTQAKPTEASVKKGVWKRALEIRARQLGEGARPLKYSTWSKEFNKSIARADSYDAWLGVWEMYWTHPAYKWWRETPDAPHAAFFRAKNWAMFEDAYDEMKHQGTLIAESKLASARENTDTPGLAKLWWRRNQLTAKKKMSGGEFDVWLDTAVSNPDMVREMAGLLRRGAKK